MEEILGNDLWEVLVTLNPILAGVIVAVTQFLKRAWPDNPRWATIAVGVVLTAIYYFIADGPSIIQLIVPFLTAVFAFDFIVQPSIENQKEKDTIGGGGGGPRSR